MASVADMLALALQHHQAGDLLQAENHYRHALAINPNYADAHNNLASLLLKQGKPDEAARHAQQALAIRPGFGEAYFNLGYSLLLQLQWPQAESYFRMAISADPCHAQAHDFLGYALDQQNKFAEAERSFHEALRCKPQYPEAFSDLGNCLVRQAKLEEAIDCYRQALKLAPQFATAWNNLGCVLDRQGKVDEAKAAFSRAVEIQPDYPDALCNLGDAQRRLGWIDDAVNSLTQALRLRPDNAAAHVKLGQTYQVVGNLANATASFQQALQLRPDNAEAHNAVGDLFWDRGDFDRALSHFRYAMQLNPELVEAPAYLGLLHAQLGQRQDADFHLQEAFRLGPNALVRVRAATALPAVYQSGDDLLSWRLRLQDQIQVLHEEGVRVDLTTTVAPPVFFLAYQGLNDRDLLSQIARLYVAPSKTPPQPNNTSGKIKLGLISRSFWNHSVGHWMRGLVEHFPRDHFSVHVLSVGSNDDEIAGAIKSHADHYLDVPWHLPSARKLIAEQHLDVLLFTDIGLDPNTYTLAFSRLAPIQCTTLGHPVTSGLVSIDYYISAEDLETEQADKHYSEILIRLKAPPIYVYRPKANWPAKSKEQFGFGNNVRLYICLQSLFKFHPEFDEILGGILRGDQGGILLLAQGKFPAWKKILQDRFARTMPDVVDRIQFIPPLARAEYMSLLAAADVQLDPIHFGGGVTSYEALAVGTPIVTMPSQFLRGRLTFGMYKQMNLMNCVARNAQEYIAIALQLGTNQDYRNAVRSRILVANEVLFENPKGIRELEQFLLQVVTKRECDAGVAAI